MKVTEVGLLLPNDAIMVFSEGMSDGGETVTGIEYHQDDKSLFPGMVTVRYLNGSIKKFIKPHVIWYGEQEDYVGDADIKVVS